MERKLIAAAVSSALALPMAAQAVEFAVSGHVNRAVILVDTDALEQKALSEAAGEEVKQNAEDDDLRHVDANSSPSRFRLTGSEDIGNGLTAGVNLEFGVNSGAGDGATNNRHTAVSLSGDFGKLTFGHTGAAADGMAYADGAFNGGSWLAGVTNSCSYYTNGPACPSNDGGRIPVLKYDTPALGPAKVSVSTGNDEYWDAKLTLAGGIGEAGYDFRIGIIPEYGDKDDKGDILTTSAAISFGQGTTIGAAWSRNDHPGVDNKTYGKWTRFTGQGSGVGDAITNADVAVALPLKAGKMVDPKDDGEHEYFYASVDHSYGDGSVGLYWKQGEYTLPDYRDASDVDASLWGVGWGHAIGGGVTAYAGFRHMDGYDVGRAKVDDVNLYLAGMRVTFN